MAVHMFSHEVDCVVIVSAGGGTGLVGHQAVGEPQDEERLQKCNDQEEVVPQFACPLCHMRLDRQT